MFRKDIIIIPSQENSKAEGKISKLSHHETESQGKTRRKEAKIGKHIRIVVRKASRQTPIFQLKIGFEGYQALVANILPCYIDQITGYRWQNQPQFKWIHVQVEALWPVRNSHVTPLICPTTGGNERWQADISFTSVALQVRWQHHWLAMEMTTEWETKWLATEPFQHNGWVVSNRWCLTLWLRDSAPTCENASEA